MPPPRNSARCKNSLQEDQRQDVMDLTELAAKYRVRLTQVTHVYSEQMNGLPT